MRIAEQIQSSGEESPLVPLALGLVSTLEQVACELLDEATVASGARTEGDALEARLEAHDPLVLAALGALSLRRTIRRWTALASLESSESERATSGRNVEEAGRGRADEGHAKGDRFPVGGLLR